MCDRPDYYAEARAIATSLFEQGQSYWGDKIEDAIAGGATGTEILMRLRFTLRELLEADVVASDDKARAKSLIRQLGRVLREAKDDVNG